MYSCLTNNIYEYKHYEDDEHLPPEKIYKGDFFNTNPQIQYSKYLDPVFERWLTLTPR